MPHRAFDPVDVEGELAGRVEHVQLPQWSLDDLVNIARQGFQRLGLAVPTNVQLRICSDGFGNPLLVQDICLRVAEALASRSPDAFGADDLAAVYDAIVEARGPLRLQRLMAARPSGGGDPVKIALLTGEQEALPAAVLSALAFVGPEYVTSLDDIAAAFERLAVDQPSKQDIASAMKDISRVGGEGASPPIEWQEAEQNLVISDPYLLFHLKWHVKDRRKLRLLRPAIDRLVIGGASSNDLSEGDQ